MKQCTYSVREMLKDLENDYQKYISMNRGESYVFAVLWEDFYDSDPNEEMIICNLIIANHYPQLKGNSKRHKKTNKISYKIPLDKMKKPKEIK